MNPRHMYNTYIWQCAIRSFRPCWNDKNSILFLSRRTVHPFCVSEDSSLSPHTYCSTGCVHCTCGPQLTPGSSLQWVRGLQPFSTHSLQYWLCALYMWTSADAWVIVTVSQRTPAFLHTLTQILWESRNSVTIWSKKYRVFFPDRDNSNISKKLWSLLNGDRDVAIAWTEAAVDDSNKESLCNLWSKWFIE